MARVPLSTFGSSKATAWTHSIHVAETRHGCSHQPESGADAGELRIAILAAASKAEARLGIASPYERRNIVDFDLVRQDRNLKVRRHFDCAVRRGLATTD